MTRTEYSNIFVVDGDNLLKRCYYATRNKSENAPVQTFITSLMRQVAAHAGGMCVVVWDGGHATWRKELIPGYKVRAPKEGREQTDAEIRIVTEKAELILNLIGIAQVRFDGVEADDIIAYLSRCGDRARIYSTDKDFLSLVRRGVRTVSATPGKDAICALGNFTSYTGVDTPTHYRMFKALAGDKGDCIEGVPGIGVKRAQGILKAVSNPRGLLREAPGRGMDAVLKVCEASPAKIIQRVLEYKVELEHALRCSDLMSPHLLTLDQVEMLTEMLTAELKRNLNDANGVMIELGFSIAQIPLKMVLDKRITRFAPGTFNFRFAKDPETFSMWGL